MILRSTAHIHNAFSTKTFNGKGIELQHYVTAIYNVGEITFRVLSAFLVVPLYSKNVIKLDRVHDKFTRLLTGLKDLS